MSNLMRVKKAADYLGVSPQTIRNWSNSGELPHTLSGAGQRLFSVQDLDCYRNKKIGVPEEEAPAPMKVFYLRSSGSSDTSHESQREKLISAYGKPDIEFSDVSSGLNDKRKGLTSLLELISANKESKTVYVTNKDRLTRFGFNYLDIFIQKFNGQIIVLDSDETKEPHEVLMQDFMSLLASFSGKFYRIRGWKQRKRFLDDAQNEVEKHVKNIQ